jgi:hypothetical protein
MNYYAEGGQAHGLKSIAQELPNYGRYNDDMVAHISSDEARLLKSLGGAGTINPVTGLPEFGLGSSLKKAWKGTVGKLEDAVKPITEPITDAIKPILPYVQYVAPFIPGVGTAMAVGLGALGGGFAGGGGFNFKRGLMGGMTAYGLSNLAAGINAAGAPPTPTPAMPDPTAVSDIASSLGSTASTAPGSQAAMLAEQSAGFGPAGLENIASSASYAPPPLELGGFAPPSEIAQTGLTTPPPSMASTISDYGTKASADLGQSMQGVKNLTGLGETTMSSKDALSALGTEFGKGSAMGAYMGATGSMALDEQEKYLEEQKRLGAITDAEYANQMEKIKRGRESAIAAMQANPYQFAQGGEVPGFAFGGIPNIEELIKKFGSLTRTDEKELRDAQTFGLDPSKFSEQGLLGAAKAVNAGSDDATKMAYAAMVNNPYQFAAGGEMPPRFLSGGGDGMSDSIKATINQDQPARLADGEFVIPADVVSHLGNGSSKAGAKQLYSMMDKVRHARTGNKEQGRQINPNKFLPA